MTLNDVQFVEAARHPGRRRRSRKAATNDESRIDFIAERLLARPFRAEELQDRASDRSTSLLAHYKAHADDAKKLIAVGESKADASLDAATLAAWTMLANELMNLDEVLNK